MGCQKGKSSPPRKAGSFECKKCGAIARKKGKICKPKKIKTD